ncbi:hypothetical protein SAMN05444157_0719 [Frankineae bacterium MT45]|nr:hypothetical protein SAMN05444157_0719 [Frankineae bacterium MT45]
MLNELHVAYERTSWQREVRIVHKHDWFAGYAENPGQFSLQLVDCSARLSINSDLDRLGT